MGGRVGSEGKIHDAPRVNRADRDVLALGIGIAAIIMFVGTGGNVMPQVVHSLQGIGLPPDRLLSNALLLNIALIIFGLRRYRDLTAEVQERRRAETTARELAETDPLTGCLNRRSIGPATDKLMAACAERGEIVAFMMIDIDDFKRINDANGHSAGDKLLQQCADRIGELMPERGLLARLGGDEFACVVPFRAATVERIDDFADRITREAARPVALDDLAMDVTVSVGIARSDSTAMPDRPVDAQELLHMADVAMYVAKKSGKSRHCWFEQSMEQELRFRNELEQAIRTGVQSGEFTPYYEQQIDLQTGQISGFEMLARWNSDRFRAVGPDVFIPIAEEIGLIADLSEALIRQALRDAKDWNPRLTLSVNISPVQMRDPWFAQKLLKLLVEANFPPNRLEVEITETCVHENIAVVRSLITSLKNQGVAISLDDFGSGYSSLAQLRSLSFDRLKIDRSFVTSMPGSHDNARIVEAIASLGKGLGLPITAEGVETTEVVAELQRLGRFMAQGYLYGHPETAAQTRERLAALGLLAGRSEDEPDRAGSEPLSGAA